MNKEHKDRDDFQIRKANVICEQELRKIERQNVASKNVIRPNFNGIRRRKVRRFWGVGAELKVYDFIEEKAEREPSQ